MHILIIEDEKNLAEVLGQILIREKYIVDKCYDGIDGLEQASSGIYDVIIMDVMMPGMDGFEVTTELRKRKIATPILLLTAKGTTEDKVEGLDCGADDYMTKPFVPKELLARIRALSRRQGEVFVETMEFGDLCLKLSTCELCCHEKSTKLSYKEFEIIKILMANASRIIEKEELLVKVWGYEGEATENNVEAYISFLRKKLSYIASDVELKSIRKLGYKLEKKDDKKA